MEDAGRVSRSPHAQGPEGRDGEQTAQKQDRGEGEDDESHRAEKVR